MYDVDNDGYVTKDEMLKVVEAICSSKTSSINCQQTDLARQRVENIFISMDSVRVFYFQFTCNLLMYFNVIH